MIKIFVSGVIVAAALALAGWNFYTYFAAPVASAPIVVRDLEHESAQEVVQELVPAPTTLMFAGDVLLARDVEFRMRQYGGDYPYRGIVEELATADAVIGNFEATIPFEHSMTPSFVTKFSVAEEYVDDLAAAGFTHVSLANNHALDFGEEAYANARAVLEENDIVSFGRPNGMETTYITLEDGRVVAVLGVHTLWRPPTHTEIQAALAAATAESDLQIVYIHWGVEYATSHSHAQETLAQQAIDAGADMIVGHHPHVVQDVQVYKDKLIFYSLGNFVFDQYFSADVQDGLLLKLVTEDSHVRLDLLPVTSRDTRNQPHVMTNTQMTPFLQALAGRSDESLEGNILTGSFILDTELAI